MHICAGLTAASWIMEPFGKIGAIFSLQLSSPTQFAKISNKKVIAENQCEKHKKKLEGFFFLLGGGGGVTCLVNATPPTVLLHLL